MLSQQIQLEKIWPVPLRGDNQGGVDVLDNVIAAVTNDLPSHLKVRVCNVSTFYSEPQHLSTAVRFLH